MTVVGWVVCWGWFCFVYTLILLKGFSVVATPDSVLVALLVSTTVPVFYWVGRFLRGR